MDYEPYYGQHISYYVGASYSGLYVCLALVHGVWGTSATVASRIVAPYS